MIISIFLCVTYILVSYFFIIQEKAHRQINAFLYFFLLLININCIIVIGKNLKKMTLTNDVGKYLSFLLYRNIFIPLLIILGIQFFFRFKSKYTKGIVVFLTVGALYLMEVICIALDIFKWKQWSFIWSICYYMFLFGLGYLSVRFFKKVSCYKGREME